MASRFSAKGMLVLGGVAGGIGFGKYIYDSMNATKTTNVLSKEIHVDEVVNGLRSVFCHIERSPRPQLPVSTLPAVSSSSSMEDMPVKLSTTKVKAILSPVVREAPTNDVVHSQRVADLHRPTASRTEKGPEDMLKEELEKGRVNYLAEEAIKDNNRKPHVCPSSQPVQVPEDQLAAQAEGWRIYGALQGAAEENKKAVESAVDFARKLWEQEVHELNEKLLEAKTLAIELAVEETEERLFKIMDDKVSEMEVKCQQHLNEERRRLLEDVGDSNATRQGVVDALFTQLDSFEDAFKTQKDFQDLNNKVLRLSNMIPYLEAAFENGKSFESTWSLLETVGSDDHVVATALSLVPKSVVESGLPTLQSLQSRFFDHVERPARQAAMINEYQGSFVGAMWSSVLSHLLVSDPRAEYGSSDQACISRAGYFLNQGHLLECLSELNQLSAPAHTVCKDWESLVYSRLIASQALGMIKAEVEALSYVQQSRTSKE